MTSAEVLTGRFTHIPRIEETGPQKGYNGKRMARKGLRTRAIHAVLCILGLIPLVLKIAGVTVSPVLIAIGAGLIVPGGGFLACAGPATVIIGLFVCFYLWKKRAMRMNERMGTWLGIAGFWLLGALGGFLAGIPVFEKIRLTQWWDYSGFVIAVVCAFVLFLPYEVKVRKIYKLMKEAREQRIAAFDESISHLDEVTDTPYAEGIQELDEEGILAARYLYDMTVNHEDGDLQQFSGPRFLSGLQYQLSTFGYGLMVLHAKYLPNFTGYLKEGHRFLIKHFADPRTCGYWAKQALTGYFSKNPDPVVKANVMLSGWMLPTCAGYYDQYHDDEFEREPAIKFQPYKDKPEETYDYSVKGIVDVLYRQYHNKEYPYMLIPCEPHLAFPMCNVWALEGMLMYDRVHDTHYCDDIWDDLYDNVSHEFIEIDGSMALRRHYQYGLRHLPASRMPGYDPLADVQNYMHYGMVFPGLGRRCYAQIRKHEIEFKDGLPYLKRLPWEKIVNMFTQKPDPSLQIAMLEMTAIEFGDTELAEGLRKIEAKYLSRSKEPNSFQYKDVTSLTMSYYAFIRFAKKGYWSDVIQRGMPETAFTGPLLAECEYPKVIPAKATSSGDDLELVLYNGAEPGEQRLKLERLKPDADYSINGEKTFKSDSNGQAELYVYLDGRTALNIMPA